MQRKTKTPSRIQMLHRNCRKPPHHTTLVENHKQERHQQIKQGRCQEIDRSAKDKRCQEKTKRDNKEFRHMQKNKETRRAARGEEKRKDTLRKMMKRRGDKKKAGLGVCMLCVSQCSA